MRCFAFPHICISTHAPRTGSDHRRGLVGTDPGNFNPRSPHGERLKSPSPSARRAAFQPTLPARGATDCGFRVEFTHAISTHAPRTGSDTMCFTPPRRAGHFNPRSPHGERRTASRRCVVLCHFNPRSPHGERLICSRPRLQGGYISTHAPRTGSDKPQRRVLRVQPISTHAPRTGSDPRCAYILCNPSGISTHAPRTGSDKDGVAYSTPIFISTHAPRTGSDQR